MDDFTILLCFKSWIYVWTFSKSKYCSQQIHSLQGNGQFDLFSFISKLSLPLNHAQVDQPLVCSVLPTCIKLHMMFFIILPCLSKYYDRFCLGSRDHLMDVVFKSKSVFIGSQLLKLRLSDKFTMWRFQVHNHYPVAAWEAGASSVLLGPSRLFEVNHCIIYLSKSLGFDLHGEK